MLQPRWVQARGTSQQDGILAGVSIQEVGRRLGAAQNTVRPRIRRGSFRLTRSLRPKGFGGWWTWRMLRFSPEFDRVHDQVGWPSIPPEQLLKASLLISLYSVPSERVTDATIWNSR